MIVSLFLAMAVCKIEVHENFAGEIQQVAICIRSALPLRRPKIVVVIVEVSWLWLWLLVVDILLLLVNIALVVVCHMKLTVLGWLSSLITYILPY